MNAQSAPNNNKRNLIIATIIVVLVIAGYFIFKGPAQTPDSGALLSMTPGGIPGQPGELGMAGGAGISGDILPLLHEIDSLKLDNSIFSDPYFMSLQDFSVQLGSASAGRDNPFAPIGSDGGVTTVKTPAKTPVKTPAKKP